MTKGKKLTDNIKEDKMELNIQKVGGWFLGIIVGIDLFLFLLWIAKILIEAIIK
jgi:hypothetical protein